MKLFDVYIYWDVDVARDRIMFKDFRTIDNTLMVIWRSVCNNVQVQGFPKLILKAWWEDMELMMKQDGFSSWQVCENKTQVIMMIRQVQYLDVAVEIRRWDGMDAIPEGETMKFLKCGNACMVLNVMHVIWWPYNGHTAWWNAMSVK